MISLILFAVWNGLVIVWGLVPDKNKVKDINDWWHATGFLVRVLVSLAILLNSGLLYFWLSVIVGWHLYDLIINLIRCLPWYHTGTNFFDRSPWCWIFKALILLSGLLFLI